MVLTHFACSDNFHLITTLEVVSPFDRKDRTYLYCSSRGRWMSRKVQLRMSVSLERREAGPGGGNGNDWTQQTGKFIVGEVRLFDLLEEILFVGSYKFDSL